MATNAFLGSGATLSVGDTSGATNLVAISEVKSLSGPSASTPQIACTHFGSASEEYISGLASQGTISVTCNFDPSAASQFTAAKGILGEFTAKTVRYWRIQWNDSGNTTATFQAFVSSRSIETPANGAVELSFDLTVSGGVTFA